MFRNSLLFTVFACLTFVSAYAQRELYPFMSKGKYGYINKSGKIVVNATYNFAEKFSDGLAAVKVGGKKGFVDVCQDL